MTGREHLCGVLEIVDSLGFSDELLIRRRRAFVTELGLDERTIEAACGFLHFDHVLFSGSCFELAPAKHGGEPGVLIGALDASERMIDVVAWPIERPDEVATFGGFTSSLMAGVHSLPSTNPLGPTLVHLTPLRWLQHRFEGVVILDVDRAGPYLLSTFPVLALEDADIARALLASDPYKTAALPRFLVPAAIAA